MVKAFGQLDRILRGEVTTLTAIRQKKFDVPVIGLSHVLIVLGIAYGLCMGIFSLTSSGSGDWRQVLASMFKVPALFVLTLIVTSPSLYVFNALFGSRLRLVPMIQLMIGSLAVTMAVLSSIGPVVAFFSCSTSSYSFIVILNVIAFAIAGVLGLGFLLQTLHRMTIAEEESVAVSSESSSPAISEVESPAAVKSSNVLSNIDHRRASRTVWMIFRIWVVVFGLVGSQMAWILRPFIGSPHEPFTLFRSHGGSFIEAILTHVRHVIGI